MSVLHDIQVPEPLSNMRRYELDDALLLFDRNSGQTALCDGAETLGLRRQVPRVVQFALSNSCNLTCSFCYRDEGNRHRWSMSDAFQLLRDLGEMGVLEVAFGGGEPFLVPYFTELVQRLYHETELAVSVTTNGTRLTEQSLQSLAPLLGQLRLSIYGSPDWRPICRMLAASGVRWGANYLLTPARVQSLAADLLELTAHECRDILLLSYNGSDRTMHLSPEEIVSVGRTIRALWKALVGRVTLKLSVCWGSRMGKVPQLFSNGDCGAGVDFVVVTANRKLQPCSFHQLALPFKDAKDLIRIWRQERERLRSYACIGGCARIPDFGLERL